MSGDPRIPPPCPCCGHPVWHDPACGYPGSLWEATDDLSLALAEVRRVFRLEMHSPLFDRLCLVLCERFPRTNLPTWVLESAARAYRMRDV